MAALANEEDPRHAQFLDLCLLYGDFNRPVFLEAILRWFVKSADAKELAALRRSIRDRTKHLKQNRKKGRPGAEHDPDWIRRSLQIVWQREILHWHWRKIAAAAGLKPTKANIRTLQNRCDRYALLVRHTLPPHAGQPPALKRLLDSERIRLMLRSRLSLPFDTRPEGCKRLVRTLVYRGPHLAAGSIRK
ncbi:MAG TPA: hypothetical protein VJX29_06680 [Candidatus Acidoferrales bacterium]|nr:hypothetical protein [Candidatus Acidoferrales bacterium]